MLLYWWIGAYSAELLFNDKRFDKGAVNLSKYVMYIAVIYLLYIIVGNFVSFKGGHIFKSLWLAVMTGFVVFWVVLFENSLNRKKVSVGTMFMARIGEYSYSLYVVHAPLLILMEYYVVDSLFKSTPLFYFCNIFGVVIFTVLFYKIIEKPSHEYAKISSNKALSLLYR